MSLRHGPSLAQSPLDYAVFISIPFETNIFLKSMNPFVVWKELRQLSQRSYLSPRERVSALEGVADRVSERFVSHRARVLAWLVPVWTLALRTDGWFDLRVLWDPLMATPFATVAHHGYWDSRHNTPFGNTLQMVILQRI